MTEVQKTKLAPAQMESSKPKDNVVQFPADYSLHPTAKPSLAKRFGLLVFPLLCYFVVALVYWGKPITVSDELAYVQQAVAFSEGRTTSTFIRPLTGITEEQTPSRYAPGTSALMAPFVAALGWEGAYLLPTLMLVVAITVMGAWLELGGHSPLWAILMLANPSVVVLGFHAMSDVPSLAAVTVALAVFWHGAGRHWGYWFAAGFLASASCLIRETNAILYVPFFLGALFRRERNVWALILGGLLGLIGVAIGSYLAYGQFLRRGRELSAFSFRNIPGNIPLYLMATMVTVPAGLVVAFCYRGARSLELRFTVAAFLGFMLTWVSAVEGDLVNRVILHAPRFSMSLLPLFVWAWADVGSRWWSGIQSRQTPDRRARWARIVRHATYCAVVVVALVAIGVRVVFGNWQSSRVRIIRDIYTHTTVDCLILSNTSETRKVINELYGRRRVLDLKSTDQSVIHQLLATNISAFVVLVFRTDGVYHQRVSDRLQNKLDNLKTNYNLTLLMDRSVTATDRLAIWKVNGTRN